MPVPPAGQYPARQAGANSPGRALLGLALLLPALIALIWSYVVPTASTVLTSFRHENLFREPRSAGIENYQAVFEDGFLGQFGLALLLGLLPLAFALLVAPLLAVVADRAGRLGRLLTRAVLAVPIAGYAPVAVFLGWRLRLAESGSLGDGARFELTWILAATSFGLVVAVAATAFLSALRQREPGRWPTPALLTVGGLVGFAVLALSLQIFTAPALLTGGGPARSTMTPVLGTMQTSFTTFRLGLGAATSTLLLVVLGGLGLAATGLLLASRTRIEFDGWRDRPGAPPAPVRGPSTVHLGIVIAGLVVVLGVFGWASAPWLRHAFAGADLPGEVSTVDVLVNTWLPPFVSALVSVGLAAVAGFGIGALRPLGRWSELLLLPFAPWLFVGIGPLAVAGFKRVSENDQVNTFLGMIPPVWLCVPALFVFTLLFRGQQPKWRAGGNAVRTLLLPALPMLAVAFLLTWLFSAQQPLWPRLVTSDPENASAPLLAEMLMAEFGNRGTGLLGLVLPLPLLVMFLLAFAGLQIGYLDRLAIRVGRSAVEPAPQPGPPPHIGSGGQPVPAQPYGPPTQPYPASPYGVPPSPYPPQPSPYGGPPVPPQPYGPPPEPGQPPQAAQSSQSPWDSQTEPPSTGKAE
ncbi:sugar ABC transporter permease [Plantactinospora sp. CA-294935]|uniref:sugar ABC transporter permease n=1 Tax=Plantactinospora sp. CA-294935 TaxID=3240012 RepID=UPI003D89FD6E